MLAFFLAPAAAQATYGFSTTGPPDWIVQCYQPDGTLYSPVYDPSHTPHEKNAPCPYPLTVQNTQDSPYTVSGLWDGFRQAVLSNGYLRFWIPYNALEDHVPGSGSPGTCKQSNFNKASGSTSANGQQLFNDLIWNIQYAQQAVASPLTKLSVDIQIEGASGDPGAKDPTTGYYGDPEYPEPYYGLPGQGYDYGMTTGGKDYRCGVQALLSEVHDALVQQIPDVSTVVQWEAMNEPDARQNDYYSAHPTVAQYPYDGPNENDGPLENACPDATSSTDTTPYYSGCGMPPSGVTYNQKTSSGNGSLCGALTFSDCGTLEAAELWEIAKSVDTQSYRIAALTSDYPDLTHSAHNGFNLAYVDELNNLYSSTGNCQSGYPTCWPQYPTYWSVHDYNDPTTGGGTCILSNCTAANLQAFEKMLSSNARQAATVWITESAVWLHNSNYKDDNYPNGTQCSGDESAETDKLGCIVDGSYTNQELGAEEWQSLLNTSAPNVTTTQVYWFELNAHTSGWDSGLLDASDKPRASYCALVPSYTNACNGNLDDFGPGG